MFRNLQRALAIYTTGASTSGSPVEDKAALVAELEKATSEALAFCARRDVAPERLFDVGGFERLARLGDMVEGLSGTDGEQRAYLALAGQVWGLFKGVMPDERAEPFRRSSAALQVIAERIRALIEKPDVDAVQARIEALLDEFDRGRGYHRPHPPGRRHRGSV